MVAVRRIAGSWMAALAAGLAVALWWAAQTLPTAAWYFEARSMLVPDAPLGSPVVMVVDRSIWRHAYGEWTVTVRRQGRTGWEMVCIARGEGDYAEGSALPDPLTLDWWTAGQCPALGAGTYFITTTWAFQPPRLLPGGPRRTAPLISNAFRVLEVEP